MGSDYVQKNHRDYTVGELLDMGFKVEVKKYDTTERFANEELANFGGLVVTTHSLGRLFPRTIAVKGRWGRYYQTYYVDK